MVLDHTTLYFKMLTHPRGGQVFVFHHAASKLSISLAEAPMVMGLPEGFTLDKHPELPGHAGWIYSGEPYKGGFALAKAGFATEPHLVGTLVSAPPSEPSSQQSGVTREVLSRRNGMVVIGERWPSTPTPDPGPPDGYGFDIGLRNENGQDVVRVRLGEYNKDDAPDCHLEEIEARWADDHPHLVLPACLTVDSDDTLFRGHGTIAHVKAALEDAGFHHLPRQVMVWLEPEEALFGITQFDPSSDDREIFIIAKDANTPYFDALRCDHLKHKPPYITENLSENTWATDPSWSRDDIKADMISRGYTHDPEIEEV